MSNFKRSVRVVIDPDGSKWRIYHSKPGKWEVYRLYRNFTGDHFGNFKTLRQAVGFVNGIVPLSERL